MGISQEIRRLYQLENMYDQFFISYDGGLPIVLYGYGKGCTTVLDMLQEQRITPAAICDSNRQKHGKSERGIRVTSIEEVKGLYSDFYVLISAPVYAKEIEEYLKGHVAEERIKFFWKFQDKLQHNKYLIENIEHLKAIYDNLGDNKSQRTLINMLKGWITSDYRCFKEVYESDQYFPKNIITLNNNEVFIDAGAYIGDTICDFINRVGDNYDRIFALEPNPHCFDELNRLQKRTKGMVVIKKGAYEYQDTLAFVNDSSVSMSSAHLTKNMEGTTLIPVDSIDNQSIENVSFIKMDIEGSELAALKGARETILKHRPKLAICVYHNYQDIVEIPRYIMSLGLNYRYFLRHHSYYTGETVFYAV